MENLKKYNQAFIENFEVKEEELEELKYQSIESWDSIGHMNLVATIEDEFDIMMETDDIIEFNSYKKGIELLKKYGVEL